ncbi:MAG: hypothetical protein WCA22_17950 [Candidatus Binatus sp.]
MRVLVQRALFRARFKILLLLLRIPGILRGRLLDVLNDGDACSIAAGRCALPIPACWGRIIEVR